MLSKPRAILHFTRATLMIIILTSNTHSNSALCLIAKQVAFTSMPVLSHLIIRLGGGITTMSFQAEQCFNDQNFFLQSFSEKRIHSRSSKISILQRSKHSDLNSLDHLNKCLILSM